MKVAKHYAGFSLLEFLLYFLLVTFLVMLVMSWATRLHTQTVQQGKECTAHLSLRTAYDRLIRDLRQAPQLSSWKKNETNCYVWSQDDHDVGWECTKQGVLIRSEGDYHPTTDSWKKRTKGTVAEQCEQLQVAAHEITITANLTGYVGKQKITLSRTAHLYNGTCV